MSRCLSCGCRARGGHAGCAAPAPAEPPREVGGPLPAVPGHAVERVLGCGGFATVVAAVRTDDGLRLALKVARGAAGAAQLAREAQALREIGPPAVPAVLGAGALGDGTPFLALELVEAPSLAARLAAADGPLAPDTVRDLGLAAVEALAAVHRAGWAHGDVKPENVLLPGERHARLLDLGLATPLRGAPPAAEPIETAAGTAEYMAPELCLGGSRDARSDVYAAGVLLFELATGRTPFFGAPADVRRAQVDARPPRPGSLAPVAPALEAILLRCLAKDRDGRPASAEELRAELERLPRAATVPAPATAPRGSGRVTPAGGGARRVGALFLEARLDPVALQRAAASVGGAVAHAAGDRFALVFEPGAGENPVAAALRAARALVARGVAPRALVDVVTVTALARPGGATRYVSAAFADARSWPRAEDPPGPLATARAAEVLDVVLAPVAGREDLLACLPAPADAQEATVVRGGAGPLLGRDEVLERLAALARRATAERAPTVVTVLADAGLGKTHLAATLAARLRTLAPAPEVLDLRAVGSSESGEAGTAGALLRRVLGVGAAPPPGAGRALLEEALDPQAADAWPGAALALGWLAPDAPELRPLAAAPGALAAATVRATGALLRRRARARPLCLLLDDAHLADGTALDALENAAVASAGAPLFVCALARPSFEGTRPFFGERAAVRHAERLGPLSPAVAAALCRGLLFPAEGVSARAVDRLVSRAQGVPLLLVELVRGLKRGGAVRRHARGEAHYLATDELDALPDLPLVEWLAQRELAVLPADLAGHAQLAALLGDELVGEEVDGVLRELEDAGQGAAFPLDGRAATRRLLSLGLLVLHRDGRAGFRLPLVREALARGAPEPLRRAVHEAALRFLSRPGALPEPARLARVARHAAGIGRRAEAGAILLELARDRRDRQAYLEAEALYSRALDQLPEDAAAERRAALHDRGVARIRLGRYDDAVADLEAARRLAGGDLAARVDCLLEEATALDWALDHARAAARVEEATAAALEADAALAGRLALARGRTLFRAARWEEARAALGEAVAASERAGDAGYESLVVALLLIGAASPFLGRAGDAEAALARAERLATERGDLLHASVVSLNRRNLLVARGDLAAAVRDQLRVVSIAEELGLLASEYAARFNLAELHYQAAVLDRAEPHLVRAEELERRHPELAPVPVALLLRARLRLFSGDLAGARAALEAFRAELAARRGAAPPGPSEAVLVDLVDLATRRAPAAEWDALLARSARDSVEQEPVEVLELRGLAALREGDRERAAAALRAALDAAARIPTLLAPRVRRALAAIERDG